MKIDDDTRKAIVARAKRKHKDIVNLQSFELRKHYPPPPPNTAPAAVEAKQAEAEVAIAVVDEDDVVMGSGGAAAVLNVEEFIAVTRELRKMPYMENEPFAIWIDVFNQLDDVLESLVYQVVIEPKENPMNPPQEQVDQLVAVLDCVKFLLENIDDAYSFPSPDVSGPFFFS
jgi:hypothetical protein